MTLTPRQRALVVTSFQKIVLRADTTFELMYRRLFEMEPRIQPLFKDDLRQQKSMFVQILRLIVADLHAPDKLRPVLRELGLRHVNYGAQPADYDLLGTTMLWAFEQVLSPVDFTTEVKEAWKQTYHMIVGIILEEAYQESES